MLVLSRRCDETIRIGNDVKVTVVAIKGHSVRLGFTAPFNVPIYREEVYQMILKEKESTDASRHSTSRLSNSEDG